MTLLPAPIPNLPELCESRPTIASDATSLSRSPRATPSACALTCGQHVPRHHRWFPRPPTDPGPNIRLVSIGGKSNAKRRTQLAMAGHATERASVVCIFALPMAETSQKRLKGVARTGLGAPPTDCSVGD